MLWRKYSFPGVGYNENTINSSQCHLCRAVLSNQNALRYHLNYVHGVHGEPNSNHGLIQSLTSSTTSVTSADASTSAVNNKTSANNKKTEKASNNLNSNTTTVIKKEEK